MARISQIDAPANRQDGISHVERLPALSVWRRTAARFGWTSISDGMLGAFGCAAALTCAGFAAYMSANPRPSFNGVEHLMIFAQPNYQQNPHFAAAQAAADRKGIDYSTTGTIRPANGSRPADRNEPIVTSYRLHYVHNGEALIIGRDDAVYQVSLGSLVPGIGRVVSIENRRGQWVVVTPRGLIVAQ